MIEGSELDLLGFALMNMKLNDSEENPGIFLVDANGIVLGINEEYEGIADVKAEEWVGKSLKKLMSLKYCDRYATLETLDRKAPISFEQKIYTGKRLIVTGNPIFNQYGKIVFVTIAAYPFHQEKIGSELQQSLTVFPSSIEGIIYKSPCMQNVLQRAVQVAASDSTVLISGESGVGKEVVAKLIHQMSPRHNKPFIYVNVAAIPEMLVESELFGYQKGSFTGALNTGKKGLVHAAHGGTLFIDEISEIPLNQQVKLLRFLQNKEALPVGSLSAERLDVRILAATNRHLPTLVKEGRFREDLFYRLNVIPIFIPPLRSRVEDIYALATTLFTDMCNHHKVRKSLTPSAIQALLNYPWPGNVRELRNLIERIVVIYPYEQVTGDYILDELQSVTFASGIDLDADFNVPGVGLDQAVSRYERKLIEHVYRQNNFDIELTAKALKVHRTTIMRKLRK